MLTFFERIPYGESGDFSLFTITHYLVVIVSAIIIYLFYLITPFIKKSQHEKKIRYTIGVLLILSSIPIWTYAFNNNLPWYMYLPEATCGWATYLGAYTMFTGNRKTFSLTFMWGWGVISTFLASNILEGPDRFNFYNFFFRHILIMFSIIYMYKIMDYRITKKDFKLYFIVTLIMAVVGGVISNIVNNPTQLNMFYMLQPAKNTPILGYLLEVHYLLYVFVWLGLATLVGYLWGLPFYQKNDYENS